MPMSSDGKSRGRGSRPKFKTAFQLYMDWNGVDRPQWRHEGAKALVEAVDVLMQIILIDQEAKGNAPSLLTFIARWAIMEITEWSEEDLDEELDELLQKIKLLAIDAGSMQ